MTMTIQASPNCGRCSLIRCCTIMFLLLMENVPFSGSHTINDVTLIRNSPRTAFLSRDQEPDGSRSDAHRLVKRMELESCLGQFDVHKNTIIRTGESQAMGGKYLQGLELDTMEECQRLCCETDSCDVYIFEDKNDGYCYLFECGPPENFHCKFTRHANYTSAVLTTVRHGPDVTTARPSLPQIGTLNISQQELELTSLKVRPEVRDKPSNSGVPQPAVGNGSGGGGGSLTISAETVFPQKAPNNSAHCGRFQFSCHSGECIAVYNACDGIPQCEDGSDEGPECSGVASSPAIVAGTKSTNNDPVNINMLDSIVQKPESYTQYQASLMQQSPSQQLQAVQQQKQEQQQQQQHQQNNQNANIPPIINNREDPAAWVNRKLVAEAQQQLEGMTPDDTNNRFYAHKEGINLVNSGIPGTYANNMNQAPNFNPLYAPTLQRAGIYMPQLQEINGGLYTAQQPQLMPAQGQIIVPPNVNWPPQQQVVQSVRQQPMIAPQISSATVQLQQQPQQQQQQQSFLLNPVQKQTIQQSHPLLVPNFQSLPSKDAVPVQENSAVPAVVQQTPSPAASITPIAPLPTNAIVRHGNTKLSPKAKQSKETNSIDVAEYEEDDDSEQSTEPPKKKTHKHKKMKSKLKEFKLQSNTTTNQDALELSVVEPVDSPGVTAAVATPAPPISQSSPVHEQYKMIHESLALEFRDHDGLSDRPGGAMLSLTLGLLITAALAILIGCRMRTVGRRGRRIGGKAPYSHEADFLVNGMYL